MSDSPHTEPTPQPGAEAEAKRRDDESAALIVAQSFIIFSAIYWFLQIESVRELLELAYG